MFESLCAHQLNQRLSDGEEDRFGSGVISGVTIRRALRLKHLVGV